MTLTCIARQLVRDVGALRFGPPVTHVYNPLVYAWSPHESYLRSFGRPPKEAVLVGMNPGPWGMAQSGVPFGEVHMVRDWLGIEGVVNRPDPEHPKRPVFGFDCARSEVSGRRLWGWAQRAFGSAESFAARFFIHNYCPLMFLEASGRNRTPDRLPAAEKAPLLAACDRALRGAVEVLRPQRVIGIGSFAAARAASVLAGSGIEVARVLHPSPASPAANRGWAEQVTRQLRAIGLEVRDLEAAPDDTGLWSHAAR